MTTEIVEYSKTEAALADLATRYKGVLFDVTTREGMATAVKGRAELRGLRIALEKTRKEIKNEIKSTFTPQGSKRADKIGAGPDEDHIPEGIMPKGGIAAAAVKDVVARAKADGRI